MRILLLLLFPLWLTSCSFGADTKTAEIGVESFHRDLEAGRYNQIYAAADPQFKAATTTADWSKMLGAIHTKLGAYRSGKTVGWTENATTGGKYITLNREANYVTGPAQEQFIFRIDGNKVSLFGYHINSMKFLS